MGNDGGSIPKRGDMVKIKARPLCMDKDQLNVEKWTLCALSMDPLQKPVVACRLGRMYNKESVLNFLLDKSSFSEAREAFSHITGLKDVKELKLKEAQGTGFVCPVTGKEMNGKTRFFYHPDCGCVMSFAAVLGDQDVCMVCSQPASKFDRIVLNGTAEEVEALRQRLPLPKKKDGKRPENSAARKRPALSEVGGEILALKRNKNIDELYTTKR